MFTNTYKITINIVHIVIKTVQKTLTHPIFLNPCTTCTNTAHCTRHLHLHQRLSRSWGTQESPSQAAASNVESRFLD